MTLYEYDKNGNVINKKVDNGLETTYEYNDANLITKMINKKGMQVYNEYLCTYNRDGSKYDERETGKPTKFYSYDKMGRLSSEGELADHFIAYYNNSYTYDLNGNRIRTVRTDNQAGIRNIDNYTYDANNRLTGKNTVLADNMSTLNGQITDYTSYFYDNNGNTTAEQTFSYTTGAQSTASAIAGRSNGNSLKVYEYNAFNQLTAYSDGSSSAQYQYNANGLRTKKTLNGQSTGFIWNGTNLAAETSKGGITNTYTYDITGIHSTNQNGTIGIYQKNPHGDITSIVDSSGTKLNTYNYDAFGNETINEETIANPFRYAGEYYDTESGNIYLRARYYTPSAGRFINEDPIKDGFNWYSYCAGNPVKYVDPTGLIYCDFDTSPSQLEEYRKNNYIVVHEEEEAINIYLNVNISGELADKIIPGSDMTYRDAAVKGILTVWQGEYDYKTVNVFVEDFGDGGTHPEDYDVLPITIVEGEGKVMNGDEVVRTAPALTYLPGDSARASKTELYTQNGHELSYWEIMKTSGHEMGHGMGILDVYSDIIVKDMGMDSIMNDHWKTDKAQQIDYYMLMQAQKSNTLQSYGENFLNCIDAIGNWFGYTKK